MHVGNALIIKAANQSNVFSRIVTKSLDLMNRFNCQTAKQ